MVDTCTSADFAAQLHETFCIHYLTQGGAVAKKRIVKLIEVTNLGGVVADRRQPFSLIFCDPDGSAYLPQQIYAVEHDVLGRIEIFLVPLGPDKRGMRYQAIFS